MNSKDLNILIEKIIRKKLSEAVFFIDDYNDNTFKEIKNATDKLMDTIHNSESYKAKQFEYDEVIKRINDLFNTFDSNLRKIIEPIKNDYI